MIVTEIEYHLVLLPLIGVSLAGKVKSDLAIIIPDVLLQFRGGVKELNIARDNIQVHFSSAPDVSPKHISETVMTETSDRLVRVNPELKGYNKVFQNDYFIKTGSKPSKSQMKDFMHIAVAGI